VTTAAVVLAAGAGSRFHGDTHKLLTIVRGRRLLDWALDNALAAHLDDVLLVLPPGGLVAVMPSVTVVHNERWQDGMASSLQCALRVAEARGHDAVVVALGDQPGISPDAWRAVAAADDRPVAVATYDGRRGHPVRLAAPVWPLLPSVGEAGAGGLMRERPELVREVACEGDPADVDTVEDLDRWS
jgi:CTP:molybdopterin cytidylyltransferase MocA